MLQRLVQTEKTCSHIHCLSTFPDVDSHLVKTSLSFSWNPVSWISRFFSPLETSVTLSPVKTRWLACSRDRAETQTETKKPLRRQTDLYCLWFFSTAGFRCVGLVLHWFRCQSKTVTAGSTYCTCGKVCDSLVGTVCFSPVLVMFLLGCGKSISRGWRDNGNMWLVKDWPRPVIS